ncbi:hypothetical protein [Kribbella shirazensis]|uniref:Uncharacterized protein n=1 Tax=Kribbella shirazensis TaxID=1105143 RepID=A0A7X5V594_9ACTN|nr:hypothetical protein [Kribbella shirazensis]NIK54822.1 hypothetical protein [Kribbella shirazensis]
MGAAVQHINRRLVITVSVIAVAAVTIGGAFAYRTGPAEADGRAAPLTGSPTPTTSTPTPTPISRTTIASRTPSVKPSATPPTKPPAAGATVTGPTKVAVAVSKLPEGREPQVPYLVDREIRGGSGEVVTLPGTGGVIAVGRLGEGALAIVQDGNDGTELLKTQNDKVVRRTPDVTSLVTTRDQSAAAYAAARISSLGAAVKGGTVYAETTTSVRSLKLPDSWNLQVLAFADGKVYFRAASAEDGPWTLYSWSPGASAAVKVKSVVSPTAVSANGRIAASMGTLNDSGSCSSVVEVGSGRQLFRTCDNQVSGFTPDGTTAVGGSAYGDGYCDTIQVALAVSTGKLLREWKGCFHQSVAEDDQHVLIVAVASGGGGDPGTKSAIIRCTITTGACELATPISTDKALRIGT